MITICETFANEYSTNVNGIKRRLIAFNSKHNIVKPNVKVNINSVDVVASLKRSFSSF